MLSNFCLLSGNDIPFPEAKVIIHQPTLKEIAYIGEEEFFLGGGLLNFSKNLLSGVDKSHLENISDFYILMKLIQNGKKIVDNNNQTKKSVLAGITFLSILFPGYKLSFEDDGILLEKDNIRGKITENLFDNFKKIVSQMFGLGDLKTSQDYNPSGALAKQIAEKLKKRHQQLAKIKKEKKEDTFGRYASVVSIGCGISINDVYEYTIYQLYDSIKRLNLKRDFDSYFKARLAGAKDLAEVQDWEISLDEIGKNKK
jgi:hypothetical protein